MFSQVMNISSSINIINKPISSFNEFSNNYEPMSPSYDYKDYDKNKMFAGYKQKKKKN